jgi:hypothetical protein
MTYIQCPQIDAYHCPDAVPSRRWVSMFRDVSTKPHPKHLPMNFWSASQDGAVAAAAAWWAEEQEKRARANELAAERAERLRRK